MSNGNNDKASAIVNLSEKNALQHLASVATKISGKGSPSARIALKGTPEQLHSALTALGGKANIASAVVTLGGNAPAGSR